MWPWKSPFNSMLSRCENSTVVLAVTKIIVKNLWDIEVDGPLNLNSPLAQALCIWLMKWNAWEIHGIIVTTLEEPDNQRSQSHPHWYLSWSCPSWYQAKLGPGQTGIRELAPWNSWEQSKLYTQLNNYMIEFISYHVLHKIFVTIKQVNAYKALSK